MRILFVLLICLFNSAFGQTKLEVNIPSLPLTQYTIKVDQSSLNEYNGISVAAGTTDNKGSINVMLDIDNEQPVTLFIGNLFFSLWMKPDASLTVQENSDEKYTFSGSAAIENDILFQSGLMQPYKTSANIGLDYFDPEKQSAYLDSIENKRLQIFDVMSKANVVTQKFQSYYTGEVYNSTFFNKYQYAGLLKATGKIADKDIPEGYYDFWNKFKLENDSVASNAYQSALQNYIEYLTIKKVGRSKTGTEKAWYEMFRTADSLLDKHPLSYQKQKTSYLLLLIKYFNFEKLTASELAIYSKQFPQSSSLLFLQSLWNKKQGAISQTPSFSLKNPKDELVDIKDFRGNVIYVDFWGSWCKACLINMPHAQKLKETFRNKNVVFLYINFFDTKEKWSNAIRKYNISGIHLKAEKSDEAYFNKSFDINKGFPRYALIDKQGKLVTIAAPQPQDQSTYDLIEKYLNE